MTANLKVWTAMVLVHAVTTRLNQSRIFLAVGHNAAKFGITQVLRLVRSLILARLLLPEDFGVFALAISLAASLQVLSSFGFTTHFLAAGPTDPMQQRCWLNTIWTLELLRGFLIAAILFVSANVLGDFFNSPELPTVLKVLALSPAITGLTNTGMLQFEKALRFAPVVKRDILSNILGIALTIAFALFFRHPMVLAIGLVAEACASTVLSYYYSQFRPRLELDSELAKSSLGFGKHLLLVAILGYVTSQVDNLVIGRLLGPSHLGYYVLAYSLAMMPVTIVGEVIVRVLVPYYSETWTAGDHLGALHRWVLSTQLVTWLIVGIAAVLFCNATWLISLVYGLKWLPAVAPFSVLTLGGIVRGFTYTMTPMLIASNRPDVDAKCKFAEVLLFIPALYFLVPRLGTIGAASACAASYTLAWISRWCFLMISNNISWRSFLQLYARIAFVFGAVVSLHSMLRAIGLPDWSLVIGTILLSLGFAIAFDRHMRDAFRQWAGILLRPSRV